MSTQQYDRFGIIPLEEGVAFLQEAFMARKTFGTIHGQEVKTRSLRLRNFAFKPTTCPHCNVKATHFALERTRSAEPQGRYHLNLWGVLDSGEEVLFTHDHIIPRSRGGADDFENTRPMCSPCNFKKKDLMEDELPKSAVEV